MNYMANVRTKAMTEKKHADISPSGAKRWMTCTPSVRLEKLFASWADEESEYAREGTLAHLFAEALLSQRFNLLPPSKVLTMFQKVQGDAMYDKVMRDYIYEYVDYITEIYNVLKRKDPHTMLLVEQQIDLSMIIPEGFGTGDVVIIGAGRLIYIDLKYGMGVRVEAEGNEQAFLYVYGLYDAFAHMMPIHKAEIHIYQPRIDNIASARYKMSAVIDWAENEAKPAAEKAFKGVGKFVAGEHCKFCKALGRCKTAATHNLKMVESLNNPELINDEDIVDILMRKGEFTSWIKAVADHAAARARDGHNFPGMKLVNGKADRVYANEERVVELLLRHGYKKDQLFINKLKGIGEMEKLMGKKNFSAILDGLVYKPTGAPTLVPVTDKRVELGSVASAARDFE